MRSWSTHIAAGDLVFLRYGIPAFALLPIIWRMGLRVNAWRLVLAR